MNFKYLAKKYNTPVYVYDFNYFGEQFNKLKKVFKARKSIIAYAVKANSNLSVINHFASLGSGADCVSIGEVKRALLAGIDKYKIIFSGVGKRDDEIEEALNKDILMLNIESEAELKRIEQIAKKLGKIARISIRVNPNIDPKTHPYISTGLHENKFGVDIESAKKLYLYAKKSKYLNPVGIHFHIGSQLTDINPIKEAAVIVSDLLRSLKAVNIDIKFFDVGGGLGIKYKNENLIEPYDYAQAVLSTLSGLDVTIICEPGRFLVGNGGWFLTKVLYEKRNGDKRFVIVDGAMNDLIRPSLYGAYHKIEVLNENKEKSKANIVGPICESGDFFAKDIEIAKTDPGDLVLIHSAGAYGFSMSSNYNTRPRAAEVAVINGKDRLIRRRETFEDLIACEIDYLKK
ncbi:MULTISPECIES: diaminopimelate decarboxylase [unclassified Lebetimonas]|uniref:diaminopimelate decarboxylase n=1 Tax=unclassified Lebetimonas TaxID=2648158 RepID=UPI000466CCE3|nr:MULTISPECIES: diaminopimelate decarboxylase [unclassified Lebetimonas]